MDDDCPSVRCEWRRSRNDAVNTSPEIYDDYPTRRDDMIDDDCPSVRREWRRSRNDAMNTSFIFSLYVSYITRITSDVAEIQAT
jgi:hypothetical protein